ncbi:MAG: CRTAC1 family protein [Planctomycetales bacterium]
MKRPVCHAWLLFGLAMAAGVSGCGGPPQAPTSAPSATFAVERENSAKKPGQTRVQKKRSRSAAATGEAVCRTRFVDVAQVAGIDAIYQNGAAGLVLMVEATGGGCGWIDYDADGQWDLYLPQGGNPALAPTAAQPSDALYRNLGTGRFANVAERAGIDERRYSQGLAVGDFDNDGFDDLFVANVGQDVLWRNQGDGTFVDVTGATIGAESLWGSSAAWGDIDLDGDLDLYVCNYVDFDPQHPRICHNAEGQPAMCHPNQMDPVPDECYLNQGDGRFRPVARERGLSGPGNKALGVAIADFNNDGWPDIFVANDTTPNFLFVNQKNGTFHEQAGVQGCAVATNGSPQANMGVAVGDYDHNGYLDIFVTHFTEEWNTLYRNRGAEGFQDVSALVGLVVRPLDKLGFGTVMADFDLDGQQELFIANGHIDDQSRKGRETAMPPQLLAWNGRHWNDCSKPAGEYFQSRLIARGVATCDFDNDGDLDVAVAAQNVPAAVLRNESQRGGWLKLAFTGRQENRRGIGTRVTIRLGDRTLMQELAGGTSYIASHQPILLFGLGDWTGPCDVEIRWPRGGTQRLEGVAPNQALRIVEPDWPNADQSAR